MTQYADFNKLVAEAQKSFADVQKSFPFDQKAVEENLKTVASFGERLSALALDAASRSTEIAAASARKSIDNLREVTAVRDEASAYGQALADFVQSQFELALRTAEDFGAVAKDAQTNTSALVTEAGELVKEKAAANVNAAAKPSKKKAA